jgi:hypothetical protein
MSFMYVCVCVCVCVRACVRACVRVGAPSPNATPLSSPRAQEILAVTKDNYGSVVCRSLMGVRYVPLTTPEKQLAQR